MKDVVNLSIVQFNPAWEDSKSNIQKLNSWLEKIPAQTNLVILPEMFLSGFSMNVGQSAQTMDGQGVEWLTSVASERGFTIAGSLSIHDNNQYFNRLIVASPEGEVQYYDKRHLFRMGEENQIYSPGNKHLIVNVAGWNMMPLVCYDLRFPVWSRNVNLRYDVLIYVANWPKARREVFLTLLKARAIENQCYVVGVNRTGTDGLGISYAGDSVVVDYKGNFLTDPANNTEQIINSTISLSELRSFREKFPTYLDADNFTL
jgi:omega-amidase